MPRAVREQQMMDAAVRVFSRYGYRAASMDGIAEAAGVSKPLVYLYLKSKEDLFTACIRREAGALLTALRAAVDPGLPPERQLRAGLTAFFEHTSRHRESWSVLHRQARTHGEPFATEAHEVRRQLVAYVQDLIGAAAREARRAARTKKPDLSGRLAEPGTPDAPDEPGTSDAPGPLGAPGPHQAAGAPDGPGPIGAPSSPSSLDTSDAPGSPDLPSDPATSPNSPHPACSPPSSALSPAGGHRVRKVSANSPGDTTDVPVPPVSPSPPDFPDFPDFPEFTDRDLGALAHALVGAAEELAGWAGETEGATAGEATSVLMNFAWTGLGRLLTGARWSPRDRGAGVEAAP